MFSSLSAWIVALSLAIVPALAVLDYGGVLPWTRWAVGIACGMMGVIALPLLMVRMRWSLPTLAWPIGIVVTCLILWVQTVSMPTWVVSWLSPASVSAYTMVAPRPFQPPSVAPWLTRLSIVAPAILGMSVLLGTACFRHSRAAITWMFLVTIGATVLALLGVGETLGTQNDALWPATQNMDAVPFGPYVNRNNAACQLNLALASAVGAIVFMARRSSARSGYGPGSWEDKRSRSKSFSALTSAMRGVDGPTILIGTLAVFIATAVVATGSRGGLLGSFAGFLAVVLGLSQRGRRMSPAWFAGLGATATVGLVAGVYWLGTINARLPSSLARVLDDARWGNWSDAVTTGFHHLPFGAGGGTYRYAYLPFQQSSGSAWFGNADCLPLEWFVELGFAGIAIPAAAALFLLRQSLWLRRTSHAPIDRAASAVGLFVVASQAVSQSFDFGLLQLPAVITLGASAGLVFARRVVVSQTLQTVASQQADYGTQPTVRTSLQPGTPESRCHPAAAVGCLIALMLALTWTTIAWHGEAQCDSLQRVVAHWNPNQPPAHQSLVATISSAEQLVNAAPGCGSAKQLLANLSIIQSRSEAVWELASREGTKRKEAWTLTSPSVARARFFTAPESQKNDLRNVLFSNQDEAPLRRAADLCRSVLEVCPLNDSARFTLTRLDFLENSPDGSRRRIDQIATLRCKTPESLTRAARLAIWNPGPDQATRVYQQALRLDPEQLVKEWATISRLPKESIIRVAATAGVFPLLNVADRSGGDRALQVALLERAEELISDRTATTGIERYESSLASGRIASLRGDSDEAVRCFGRAIEELPSEIDARLRLAETFRKTGRITESQQQLRTLKALSPSDSRINRLRQQIEHDLAAAER